MRRWTTAEKELLGYKRRLANNNIKVSLSRPPWEKSSIELKRGGFDVLTKYKPPLVQSPKKVIRLGLPWLSDQSNTTHSRLTAQWRAVSSGLCSVNHYKPVSWYQSYSFNVWWIVTAIPSFTAELNLALYIKVAVTSSVWPLNHEQARYITHVL